MPKRTPTHSEAIEKVGKSLFEQAVLALLMRMEGLTEVQMIARNGGSFISFTSTHSLIGTRTTLAVPIDPASSVESPSAAALLPSALCKALISYVGNSEALQSCPPTLVCLSLRDIDRETQRECEARLRECGGTVQWLTGSSLFDRFERYYPEFLSDEARAIRRTLSKLKSVAMDITPVTRVAWFSGQPEAIPANPAFFVELTVQRAFSTYDAAGFFVPLPEPVRISQWWNRNDFEYLRAAIRHGVRGMAHCIRWGYLNIDAGIPHSLQDAAYRFVSELEDAIAAARSTRNKMADQNQNVQLTSHWAAQDSPELRRLLMARSSLAESWSNILGKIRSEMNSPRSSKLFPTGHDQLRISVSPDRVNSTLNSLDFREACRFDDFAKAMPERVVRQTSAFVVQMPSPLLNYTSASLLIVGGPGSGKTSFCRWNALRDAERLATGESDVIPVLIPLHVIKTANDISFADLFLRTAGASGLLVSGPEQISENSRIRLYLDGLDEVSNKDVRRDIVEIASQGFSRFAKLQIILTARDHILEPWLDWLPRLELGGLSISQRDELSQKWLGSAWERFAAELKNSPALQSVVAVPLLATLTILVFKHSGCVPANRVRLYRMFTDLLLGGWNLAKGTLRSTQFTSDIKFRILARFAYETHNKHKRETSRFSLLTVARGEVGNGEKFASSAVTELMSDGLIESTVDGVQFRHFSFQEYLAARYLASDPTGIEIGNVVRNFVTGKQDSDWWGEVIRFFLEMSDRPADLMPWVLDLSRDSTDVVRRETVMQWIKIAFPDSGNL